MLDSPVNEMPPSNVMKHHIPTSKGHQMKKLYLGCPQKSHLLRTNICGVDHLYSPNKEPQIYCLPESISTSVLSQMNTVRCPIFDSEGCSRASAVDQSVDAKELFGTRPSCSFPTLCFLPTFLQNSKKLQFPVEINTRSKTKNLYLFSH